MAASIGVFWFRRRPNFGDALAPLLVRHFAGLDPYWTPPPRSEAVVIGSIAHRVASGYRGVVLGIGRIEEGTVLDLSNAKVLGLRGELTLRNSGVRGEVVLGDSGLLAPQLIGERPLQVHRLGVAAHINDLELAARYPDALRIDVRHDPVEVIRQIASCERIISSSLHGLVTADALGIPRLWAMTARARGSGYKFRDYSTVLGIPIEPDAWITAPAGQVQRVISRLCDAFAQLAGVLPAGRRGPPGQLRRHLDNIVWRFSSRVG